MMQRVNHGILEFYIDWEFEKLGDPNTFTLYFRGDSIPDEYLRIGFFTYYVFFERGHTNVQWVKQSHVFIEKFSMFAQRIGGQEKFFNLWYN